MGLPHRYSLSTAAADTKRQPVAINPNLWLAVRFLVTGLVCLLSLATAIMCILVVVYYNTHDPIIEPSWGSLIFLIVLGLLTPATYFTYNITLPLLPFIRYGDFLYLLFEARVELLLQFSMCVLWVSGALAYANDLRGYENCQFDGYYHYPKPADFHHVCDLINWAVPLAYATFGVQVALWLLETAFGAYTFLYLDQDSLSEPLWEWGRRAYNFQHAKPTSRAVGRTSPAYRASTGNGRHGGARGASDAGSLGSSEPSSRGRRGVAYNTDHEADADMAESQVSAPVSLGRRGRSYGAIDEEAPVNPSAGRRGAPQMDEDEESGWHLREEASEMGERRL